MDSEGRLLVERLVICDFDHEPPADLLAVFTRAMAAAPSDDGLAAFEASGEALGERLDLMGFDTTNALAELESTLEVARMAYAGMRPEVRPADLLGDPWWGLVDLDAEGWLRRVGAEEAQPHGVWSRWALALIREREPLTMLRLTALARPSSTFRLELQPDIALVTEAPRRLLVITQTADDAEALRGALAGQHPHLSDLVNITHLGGDGSGEALCAQAAGLAELRLKQPVVALFHPGEEARCAALTLPDRVRLLVLGERPLVDPPGALRTLFAVTRVGADAARRRTGAPEGGAPAEPASVRPASE